MATAAPAKLQGAAQRFVLHDIDWEGYQTFLKVLEDRPIRLTYDRGTLELMTPLSIHERYKALIGRMIDAITEELDVRMVAVGSTTFYREKLKRGLEPDQCYYFSNADKVADWARIDLDVDPPPDLAVEIDVTNDSRRRLAIYAALRIPEVWRYDGERLEVLKLQDPDAYHIVPQSEIFPFVPMEEIGRFLHQYSIGDDTQWARAFRQWFRETVLPRVQNECGGE
jgi:Uma2 family endonuclease